MSPSPLPRSSPRSKRAKMLIDMFSYPTSPHIVLCYHSVANFDWKYNVTPNDFYQQISYLLTGYRPVTLDQLTTSVTPSFTLTFDDGYKSILNTKEYLKTNNIKPVLFLLAKPENLNHRETENQLELLSDRDIRLLITDGWEIGSHGSQHPDYWQLTDRDIRAEIIESKKILESKYQVPVRYFSYPKGRYTPPIINRVKLAGYQKAVITGGMLINNQTDPYLIPRICINHHHHLTNFKKELQIPAIVIRHLTKKFGGRLLAKLYGHFLN